jgi:aromatic ring-opening dioxygenase LigB subunit
MEENKLNLPKDDSVESKKERKQFIIDFYSQWIAVNTTKQIYNKSLKDFINVRFLSIQETAGHASHTYKSTIAVTFLTEILEKAKRIKSVKPKSENKNQQRFSEMIVMEHSKKDFETIKLTVGVLKGSKQKVQYCITAIE